MQNLPLEREIASLRLRFQANNRLRLEFLGTLSKILRDYGEPVSDDLLASVVLATPNELADLSRPHEAAASKRPRKSRGAGTGPPQHDDGGQGPPQHDDGGQGPPQHDDGGEGPPQHDHGGEGPPQHDDGETPPEQGPPQHDDEERLPPQKSKGGSKSSPKKGAAKQAARKSGRAKR